MVDVAEIYIWNKPVGAVRWDQQRGLAIFQYARDFANSAWDLSPIKMPLSQGTRTYSFPELKTPPGEQSSTFQGLPGLLADSLPDRFGNQLINLWLSRNGRPENSLNPVEQLCFIGSRGMGALEFRPSLMPREPRSFTIEVQSLVESAHQALSAKSGFQSNLEEERGMQDILKIGTSAGGARPKAVIAFNPDSGEVRSGQTRAPHGFEHWIIKLDGVSDAQFGMTHGYGNVEYAYYLMAKDVGIDMMDSRLHEENGRAHFMTKRYDRRGSNDKLHMQTFCGIRHYDYNHTESYSYEQLFATMRLLRLSYPEAEQMFRRMVFNVLCTNCDDHTKNFAFLMDQDGNWKLAPAYDMCYSYDPKSIWVSKHALSVNGKREDIQLEDLLAVARTANIDKAKAIVAEIRNVALGWTEYATRARVPHGLSAHISSNLAAPGFNI